jgi:protein-tyrosine-phosphatase
MMRMSSSRDVDPDGLAVPRQRPSAFELERTGLPPLVLFVSRLNTGVSIMAEAILRHLAQDRLRAASGGASPDADLDPVHPFALECLRAHGIATIGLRSKAWGEFFGATKPPVRLLIALSDVYAAKADWPADTLVANWNTPEPADVVGHEVEIRLAFEQTHGTLHSRIREFLSLQLEHLEEGALVEALTGVGERSW